LRLFVIGAFCHWGFLSLVFFVIGFMFTDIHGH
jgi:hypothetical protein